MRADLSYFARAKRALLRRKIFQRLLRCRRSKERGMCRSMRAGAGLRTYGLIGWRIGPAAASRAYATTRERLLTASVLTPGMRERAGQCVARWGVCTISPR